MVLDIVPSFACGHVLAEIILILDAEELDSRVEIKKCQARGGNNTLKIVVFSFASIATSLKTLSSLWCASNECDDVVELSKWSSLTPKSKFCLYNRYRVFVDKLNLLKSLSISAKEESLRC